MSQMQFQHARKYEPHPYHAHAAAPQYGSMSAGSRSAHCVTATHHGDDRGEKIFQDAHGPTEESIPTPAPRQVLAEHRAAVPRGGEPEAAPKKQATFRRHQRQENIHIVVEERVVDELDAELDAEYERELLVARDRKAARMHAMAAAAAAAAATPAPAPAPAPSRTHIPSRSHTRTRTRTRTRTHVPTPIHIPTQQSAVLRPTATNPQAPTSPYGIRERPITPFGLRFRYRQLCRDIGTRWVECRGEIKGKVTLIIKGPVPVENVQEDYDLSDRKSGRNARKSPASVRR